MPPLRRAFLIGAIVGLIIVTVKFALVHFAGYEGMVYMGPTWLAIMFVGLAARLPTEEELWNPKDFAEYKQITRILTLVGWPLILVLGWMSCWHKPSWPNNLDLGFSLLFISLMTIQIRKVLVQLPFAKAANEASNLSP